MYVKVLFDEKAKKGLDSGHGFSCLIGGKILVDAGEDPTMLMNNMKRLMVSAEDLDGVIITHEHYDHTGGLWELLKQKKGLKVYVSDTFSDTFKDCVKELGGKLVYVKKRRKVNDEVFVTSPITTRYKDKDVAECSVMIKGDKGISAITGCAHSGVLDIVKYVKRSMKTDNIYMVFGGFHLKDLNREQVTDIAVKLKKAGVKKIGPSHCSGEKAKRVLKGQFHDKYVPVKAGHIIHL